MILASAATDAGLSQRFAQVLQLAYHELERRSQEGSRARLLAPAPTGQRILFVNPPTSVPDVTLKLGAVEVKNFLGLVWARIRPPRFVLNVMALSGPQQVQLGVTLVRTRFLGSAGRIAFWTLAIGVSPAGTADPSDLRVSAFRVLYRALTAQ